MHEEERNYCFLILLLSRVGLPKLRDFFINKWNSAGGFVPWTDCHQNGTDLLTKFTPLNYEKPKVQSGDTTTWDLSLFVKALLNSRPPFVPTTKKGLVAGLKYLKETRNKLCHSPNGKIENSEFCNLKSGVCNVLTQVGATSKDFKKVKKDVDHQPLIELLSLVKHCASQDEEILKQIDAIKQGQEKLKQGQSDLQQGQQEIRQGQSGLQQGQQEILKAIKYQDKESTSKPSNLSCEDVLSYSKRLKSSTKVQTEFQPKPLASPDVPSTRTDDIFTNLMIQREWKPLKRIERPSRRKHLQNYNNPSDQHLIDKCQDIFINPDHDKPNPKSILVIGKPGIGKSLFCQRLSRDWADGVLFHNNPDASRVADDFDFVFLITFRQLNLFGDKQFNFCEVLNHCSVLDDHANINEHLFEYIIGHPEKVLFILDGYDEYSKRSNIFKCTFEQKYANNPRLQMPVAALISKLLQKKIFKNAVVMVTSRPTEADKFGGIHMDAVVEIAGFSVEQVEEFIKKYFKSKKEEVKIAARDHIMNNENLLSIAHIPVLCHLMCFCLEWHIENGTEKCFPATITELYSEVVEIFEDCCKTIHRASEDREKSTVKKLTELAAAMFMEGKLIFDQRDIDRFHLTCPETGSLQSFGLLTCGPAFRERPSKIIRYFCFSHLTLHEYFAALGFVNSGIIPTLEGDGKEMVLQFCAGLLSGVEDGERLMEEMISPYCQKENGMLVAKCLLEYGDKEFGVKIIEKYHTQFSTEKGVLFHKLSLIYSSDCIALVYFLDLISQLCKGLEDTSTESFCINGLSIIFSNVSSSGMKLLADSLKNDGCPLTFFNIDLRFSNICFSLPIVHCLFPALPSTNITTLHLHDKFTDEGISCLSIVLPSTHITTLHLDGKFTDEGISCLSIVLPSTHITTLHLDGKFTDEGISCLSNVLPSTHITTLHIYGDFTDEGISTLSNVLPSTHITTLQLDGVLTDEGISTLSKVLASTHITSLHLDGDFTDEGISTLSNVLPSTHITTLHLDGVLTDEGISSLSNVLPSTHITTLHIYGDFTDEGISTLSNVLPSTHITTLHLDGVLTDEGISSLSNVLPSTHITTLSLSSSFNYVLPSSCFTDKGLLTLSEVLPSTSINSLSLKSWEITERGIDELRKSAPACNIVIY